MYVFLITMLLFLVVLALGAGIARSLMRGWVEHRVRVTVLERLAKNPEIVRAPEDVQVFLEGPGASASAQHNYALTGLFLALIGAGCIIAGRYLHVGQIAVGLHVGGIFCLVLGILLVVAGLVVRALTKHHAATATRT